MESKNDQEILSNVTWDDLCQLLDDKQLDTLLDEGNEWKERRDNNEDLPGKLVDQFKIEESDYTQYEEPDGFCNGGTYWSGTIEEEIQLYLTSGAEWSITVEISGYEHVHSGGFGFDGVTFSGYGDGMTQEIADEIGLVMFNAFSEYS